MRGYPVVLRSIGTTAVLMQASHSAINRAVSAHHHHQHHLHHGTTFPNLPLHQGNCALRHVPCRGASSASFDNRDNNRDRDSNSSSIEKLQLRWRLQSVQQRRQQEAPVPAQQMSSEETDMLWAGYR